MPEIEHNPTPLSELKKMCKPVGNTVVECHKKLSSMERLAVWITERVGTMGFFFIVFIWTFLWFAWNVFAPSGLRFDPFPAFVLWLFISNILQLFFLPLIMVGQNIQGWYSEARAEADFEVNLRAEREVETILQHLENQNKLILKILNRLNQEK